VHEAFGIVIFAVVGIGAVVAVITFVISRKAYDDIGRGAFAMRDDVPGPAAPPPASAAAVRERDDEIRQLLEARNEVRRRQGREPLDVEAEMRALQQPAIDPGIVSEIRALVGARNERRARRGQTPLDVEEEVARQIRELGGDT
jgi:uncharacterized iron-regulated membrane protein